MSAPNKQTCFLILPSLFPDNLPHRVAGIRNHFFNLRVTQRLPRFRRNGDEFRGQINLDCGDLGLFSECFFNSGRAKRTDHPVDGSVDCFGEDRARQAGQNDKC